MFRRILIVSFVLVSAALYGTHPVAQGAASVNAGKLIFTEVFFQSSTDAKDWVELYVVDGSVNWHGYRIYEGGQLRKTISSELGQALSTGDYIVFHEESGTDETTDKGSNGYWDIYGLTGLYATDLILQIKEPSGSTDRVDVVIYSNDNGSFSSSSEEANAAVDDGMWNSYDFSEGDAGAWIDTDDVDTGESLARYLDPGSSVYADSNSKDDWYHETSPSQGTVSSQTLVTLSSFVARRHEGHVTVEWETASEIDNAGFNIWRSQVADGAYIQINRELIPARGGPLTGTSYRYLDETAIDVHSPWYRLEDVDIYGISTLHGPVAAVTPRRHPMYLPLLILTDKYGY